MIVKMCWPRVKSHTSYERMVECDTIHKHEDADGQGLELTLYKDDKLIESAIFKDPVDIFIMEHGKTIDRIYFKMDQVEK